VAVEAEHLRLAELVDPDRGITYGIVKVGEFVSDGVRVIRGGDIRDGRIRIDEDKRVTEEVSRQFRRTILRGGEIVMNLIAEPGHTAIVPPELADANVTRDVAVVPLLECVDHRYVNYSLKSPGALRWLESRLQGSVTQKINLGICSTIARALPGASCWTWMPPMMRPTAISNWPASMATMTSTVTCRCWCLPRPKVRASRS